MKTIIATLAIAAASATMVSCSNSEGSKTNEGESSVETYQCPMKCEGDKTYDQAGTCPVCKMDLEKA